MVSTIYIIPIEFNDGYLLENLKLFIKEIFNANAVIDTKKINYSTHYNESRGQYFSTALLKEIIDKHSEKSSRALGICSFDLFIPIFTYVYGEAQLGGIGAIASTWRLRNEFYGAPPDKEILLERLLKESVHELGHTYGLYHCKIPGCVMNSSIYIEDVDEKNVLFCSECKDMIKELLPK